MSARRKKVTVHMAPDQRRATDHPPLSDIVTKGNLDDRLSSVRERMDGHWTLDDERWHAHEGLATERWKAHKLTHEVVAESLRDYKKDANEWRTTLSDLRGTFLPKGEFQSEHRALDAKLHGEMVALAGKIDALDAKLDIAADSVKDLRVEAGARRSVFSDTKSIVATLGIIAGVIVSTLLILDRVQR